MARIPNKLLEHSVTIRPRRKIPSSDGGKFDAAVVRKSIVQDKAQEVTDERDETKGQTIVSSSIVLVQPEHWAPPGSLITVWKGEPYEREGVVVATSVGRHSIAWESARMWIV